MSARGKSIMAAGIALAVPLLMFAGTYCVALCTPSGPDSMARSDLSAEELAGYRQAAAYSRAHRGLSMLIMKDGRIVFEDYPMGHPANEAHNLASGTKSFSCAIAVAAAQDKLLTLDEAVSKTVTEWQTDELKSQITIRQLLTLTSGMDAGEAGSIPTYAEAIEARMLHSPGTVFQYGPAPFQVFGELMRRKLAASGENARTYLERRVLQPMGVKVDSWRTGADGYPHMPAGARLTAREWVKYGQMILNGGQWEGRRILDKDLLSECFRGTEANPGYGLTFWLPLNAGTNSKGGSSASPDFSHLR